MEKNFSDLDANYRNTRTQGDDVEFHDGFAAPFVLEGMPFTNPDGTRARLPIEVARQCIEPGVIPMSMQGAGELLRFRSDATAIAIRVQFNEIYAGNLRSGSAGFDLYCENRFIGNQTIPPETTIFTATWNNTAPANGTMRDYTLYFPYHCAIAQIEVGVRPGSRLAAPTPHATALPLVFYGSSITNCGAAGRPGMNYPAIIGRMLNAPVVNMGFAGSCKGELAVADVLATMQMEMLLIEFDHNAPDAAFLREKHEPFFHRFRASRPEVPVLLMSRCDFRPEDDERRLVVLQTWFNARNAGDRLVDFLDGETLFAGPSRSDCTADGCHPNDLGEQLMAERIADRLCSLRRRVEWLKNC